MWPLSAGKCTLAIFAACDFYFIWKLLPNNFSLILLPLASSYCSPSALMCFHPVNEPSVKWRSSSVLDVSESPGCNGNCGGWWLAQQWLNQLDWQPCTCLQHTVSNHATDSVITGTARLVRLDPRSPGDLSLHHSLLTSVGTGNCIITTTSFCLAFSLYLGRSLLASGVWK